MKTRKVKIKYKQNGKRKQITVPFNESLLQVFDSLKKNNCLVLDIIASWQ